MVSVQHRLRHFAINVLAFNVCYLLSNAAAHQQMIQRHLALPFEGGIPFLPWMIVPYLSSGLFFCLGFAWVRSADQLCVLSQRLLLATVVAAFVFYAYPLQFSWPRPAATSAPLALLFDLLSAVDRPYNQLPSLHVAFCVIFWQSLQATVQSRFARALLALWLLLTALSTLFIYQHHLLDLLSGLLLGLVCLAAIKPGRAEPHVAFYYLMGAAILVLTSLLCLHSVWALYVALSMVLVSRAYCRSDRFFTHKRRGRLPLLSWVLYGPYLAGYWLTWQAVRWLERKQPTVQKISDQLWIGRRLSHWEAQQLPLDCTVFDLSSELSETASLRAHRYLHVPLLDLVAPPDDACHQIVHALLEEIRAGRTVYLHCSMGYSRCKLLAQAYLAHTTP